MAKVLVSIDDVLLARLDERAVELGLSRSALLSRIASRELRVGAGDHRIPRAIERARGACSGADVQQDSTQLIRAMRNSR